MYIVTQEYNSTYLIKKSKFITYICNYQDFKSLISRLKNQHPKARHFVYAYRYLNEFEQIVENSSDDGEPKGTSGKPALNVLSGNEMINTAVVIVRYFGGIKLGTGGLVRAYSEAVNQVLDVCEKQSYIKLIKKRVKVSYSNLSIVEYTISLFQIDIIKKEFDAEVVLILESSKEIFSQFKEKLIRDCEFIDEK
ncbi:MAG: YigZ family protein [Campylobacterota bacterium]|nr:YigZ family protein [Campylobacterota bacterium]